MGTDVVFFKLTTHVLMKNDRINPFACGFSFINLQSFKPTTLLPCTWKGNLAHTTTHKSTHTSQLYIYDFMNKLHQCVKFSTKLG